jgi:hypothetical protein
LSWKIKEIFHEILDLIEIFLAYKVDHRKKILWFLVLEIKLGNLDKGKFPLFFHCSIN